MSAQAEKNNWWSSFPQTGGGSSRWF